LYQSKRGRLLEDLIGLYACRAIMGILQRETGDDKYRPARCREKWRGEGFRDKKPARGFLAIRTGGFLCGNPQKFSV
jgi:hypothetical protein